MKIFLTILSTVFIALVLAVLGCAGIGNSRTVIPVKLQVADNLLLPFKVEKSIMDQRTATYYILEQNRPNIHLYRNKALLNTIGGFGMDKFSFQKLSDIALDSDGNLLALDEFARRIRKYSSEGKWIADIDITSFNQPNKLCSTPENDLIIYDSATKELKRISSFDGKTMFSFGRFQVDSVSGITASRDLIAVVSENKDKTFLFTGMGLFLKELPYQTVLDQYQNQYSYSDSALRISDATLFVPFGKPEREVRLFSGSRSILIVWNDTIVTILPEYQGN